MTSRIPDPAGFAAGSVGMGSFPGMPDLSMLERTGAPASVWGRLAIDVADHTAVIAACRALAVDLVVVGPEAPLAAGLVDALADDLNTLYRQRR